MIVRLALRNVWRNTRRTALTVGGAALALALMMTSIALNEGGWQSMITAAVQASAGHVTVQAPGYRSDGKVEQWVERSAEVREALAAAYPGATVVRRVWVGGLLTSASDAAAVTLQGVEPDAEAGLTLLDERLLAGVWLDDDAGILLGERLAQSLGVELGDKVVFMAQAGTPDVESRLFRVRGIYRTGNEVLDAFGAIATLPAVQEVMGGQDPAHQVAVVVLGLGDGELDLGPARRALGGREDVEVTGWPEVLPLLREQKALDDGFNFFTAGIMGLIVAVGVMNTILMSVMERVREFGVLRALGMPARALFGMVLLEGAVLGVLGGVAGVLLAVPPIEALRRWGIDYGDMLADNSPIAGVAIDTVLRATPIPGTMAVLFLGAVAVAVLAAAWPAFKAARLRPVQAIQHT